MQEALTTEIASFISELKEKEQLNGGFPDTDLMINALYEAIQFKVDNINNEIFDEISEKKARQFEGQLRDKLDLDPETRKWMAEARKKAEQDAASHQEAVIQLKP